MSYAMTMIPVVPAILSKPTKDKDAKTDTSDRGKADKKNLLLGVPSLTAFIAGSYGNY